MSNESTLKARVLAGNTPNPTAFDLLDQGYKIHCFCGKLITTKDGFIAHDETMRCGRLVMRETCDAGDSLGAKTMQITLEDDLKVFQRDCGNWREDFNQRARIYHILNDHIFMPMLPGLINTTNQIYGIEYDRCDSGGRTRYICGISLWHEKPSKRGFWYNLCKIWNSWNYDCYIHWSGGIFLLEYYNASAYIIAEEIKEKYDQLIKPVVGAEIGIINRT